MKKTTKRDEKTIDEYKKNIKSIYKLFLIYSRINATLIALISLLEIFINIIDMNIIYKHVLIIVRLLISEKNIDIKIKAFNRRFGFIYE